MSWLTAANVKEKFKEEQSSNTDKMILKQETIEIPAEVVDNAEAISTDAQSYILQQQQLPYQNIEFIEQNEFDSGEQQPEVSLKKREIKFYFITVIYRPVRVKLLLKKVQNRLQNAKEGLLLKRQLPLL